MRYLRITCPDIANGNGCRVTLWLPGCTHKCEGCHNAWTAEYNQGKEFTEETFNKLVSILNREEIQGLTLSGGDPLDRNKEDLNELYNILNRIKQSTNRDFDIWVYTGYYKEDLNEDQKHLLSLCDFLVDGPFILEKRNIMLPFRGSSNQSIWDLKTNTIIDDSIFTE